MAISTILPHSSVPMAPSINPTLRPLGERTMVSSCFSEETQVRKNTVYPDMGIESPLIWSEQCLIHILKMHEASSVNTEETGNQINPLPQQYAENGKNQGGSKKTPSPSNGATGGSRVYNQPEKSTFSLTQELEFLSFLLNSHMTTALPTHKPHTLKKMARQMSKQRRTTLRELTSLLWMMVVAHPASLPAPFH